jgi:hypothetical protein
MLWYWLPKSHVVSAEHTRLLFQALTVETYCVLKSQVMSAAQARSDFQVGATLWYWLPKVQVVAVVHTRLTYVLGSVLAYSVV